MSFFTFTPLWCRPTHVYKQYNYQHGRAHIQTHAHTLAPTVTHNTCTQHKTPLHMYTRTHSHTHKHTDRPHIDFTSNTHTHTHTHTPHTQHKHTSTCIHIHTQTLPTHRLPTIHTHTHTHTHTGIWCKSWTLKNNRRTRTRMSDIGRGIVDLAHLTWGTTICVWNLIDEPWTYRVHFIFMLYLAHSHMNAYKLLKFFTRFAFFFIVKWLEGVSSSPE